MNTWNTNAVWPGHSSAPRWNIRGQDLCVREALRLPRATSRLPRSVEESKPRRLQWVWGASAGVPEHEAHEHLTQTRSLAPGVRTARLLSAPGGAPVSWGRPQSLPHPSLAGSRARVLGVNAANWHGWRGNHAGLQISEMSKSKPKNV